MKANIHKESRAKAIVAVETPVTFGVFAKKLVADLEDGFRNPKHRQQWRNTLTTYAAPIADTVIAEVTTEQILGVLQPIWLTKPETASRVRGRIERVLDAAKAIGLRSGDNPARVRATVERLADDKVRVHCLALGGTDLTSAAGKMTMAVISAVAEFERDLLIERTQAELKRAKAEGKRLGRPNSLNAGQQETVRRKRAEGVSLGVLAAEFGVSRSAIQRLGELES